MGLPDRLARGGARGKRLIELAESGDGMAGQRSKAEIAAMNRLYYGDNLDILRNRIDSESVDLCYIDPPFNSKRNYFHIYNNQGGEDRAASVSPERWAEIAKSAQSLVYT